MNKFRFDAPLMDPDDWALFGRHLQRSATYLENWARMQGTARMADPLAVARGLADTIAAAPPGAVPVMKVTLDDADQKLIRTWLSKSLMRAAAESPTGDRPGHSDAARHGVGELLDQWESFIKWRDPLTGRRARIRVLSTGDEED
jgi:hypothetical protein